MINTQCKAEYRQSNGYAVLLQTRIIQEPVRRISAGRVAPAVHNPKATNEKRIAHFTLPQRFFRQMFSARNSLSVLETVPEIENRK